MTTRQFSFNGKVLTFEEGQSIAAALISQGYTSLRDTRFKEEPRMIFCGIGICFDCVVVVNGIPNQRACITTVSEGMKIESAP
jgi:predicted molibdopterin-dependent oxidoreductase YjgC